MVFTVTLPFWVRETHQKRSAGGATVPKESGRAVREPGVVKRNSERKLWWAYPYMRSEGICPQNQWGHLPKASLSMESDLGGTISRGLNKKQTVFEKTI